MSNSDNKVFNKVLKSALWSLAFAAFFYVLSFTKVCSFELETISFSGIFLIFVVMLFLASFWIFTYWNMDKIQKEPIKSILYTFCASLFIYFFIISIFDKAFCSSGQSDLPIFCLLKFVLLPLFSIYIVFDLFIFRLESFDEFIDSMIYGGFAGIGIGCAAFLNEVIVFDSLSVRYLVQILLVRLLICSSTCALSGFLLYKLRSEKKIVYMAASIIILFLIFSLDFFLDTIIDRNIKLSQIELLGFLIPFVLTVIVYLITVLFIAKNITKDFEPEQKDSVFYRVYGIVLFVVIIINGFVFQSQLNKTVRFFSDDKKWSFSLPFEFNEITKSKSENSFIEISSKKRSERMYQEFSDRKSNVYVSFSELSSSLLSVNGNSEVISGWKIYTLENDSYIFVKDETVVKIQLEDKNRNNRSEIEKEKIVKGIAKSLRRVNEND